VYRKKERCEGLGKYRGLRIRVTQVFHRFRSMSTVITTISEQELDYRCECAVAALADGKKVTLAPGFFRAAGISPKQLMETLLRYLYIYELELAQAEMYMDSFDRGDCVEIHQWRVFITRKPSDLSFVVTATCIN